VKNFIPTTEYGTQVEEEDKEDGPLSKSLIED
jgi:hypothetical protein